jgi:hypothetical protein
MSLKGNNLMFWNHLCELGMYQYIYLLELKELARLIFKSFFFLDLSFKAIIEENLLNSFENIRLI